MIIKSIRYAGKTLQTASGPITLDSDGITEVDDKLGKLLVQLDGFEEAIIVEEPEDAKDVTEEELEAKTLPQLKKLAKEAGLDIKALVKKSDFIQALLQK